MSLLFPETRESSGDKCYNQLALAPRLLQRNASFGATLITIIGSFYETRAFMRYTLDNAAKPGPSGPPSYRR